MKHVLLLSALVATQAHAQIVYTDVDPDTTITQTDDGSTVYALDMNNDGITEANLTAARSSLLVFGNVVTVRSVFLDVSNGSEALMYGSGSSLKVKAMNQAAFIGSDPSGTGADWSSAQYANLKRIGNVQGQGGDWSTPEDRYCAIRFSLGGAWYYGWVRVSVFPSGSGIGFTIRDYAYTGVPGEGILAGDMGSISTGITSIALQGMQVSPNPFSSALSVSLPTGTTGAVSCRVLSLQGQAVITRTVAATSGPSSITLDLGSLATGTYLLEMQVDGDRIVRKVVKE